MGHPPNSKKENFKIMRYVMLFLAAKTLIIRDKIIIKYCRYLTHKNEKIIKKCDQRAEKIKKYLDTVANYK